MKAVSGVYIIQSKASGRRYVGSAVRMDKRWREHRRQLAAGNHHSQLLQREWNKRGPDNFCFSIALICSRENVIMYEQAFIDFYKPEYNTALVAGSQLGYKHTEQTRKKMSQSRRKDFSPMTGKSHSDETKEKISAKKRGIPTMPCSAEKKAKLSAIHKGRIISAEQRAKISMSLMGHKQSAEQIEKRMQKIRGRKMPQGFAEKQRQRMLGSVMSEAAIKKMAKSKSKYSDDSIKLVRSLLIQELSHRKIEAITGVNRSTISKIYCGKRYAWVQS